MSKIIRVNLPNPEDEEKNYVDGFRNKNVKDDGDKVNKKVVYYPKDKRKEPRDTSQTLKFDTNSMNHKDIQDITMKSQI